MKARTISKTLVALSLLSFSANASAEPVTTHLSSYNSPKYHFIINKNPLITDSRNSIPIIANSDHAIASILAYASQPRKNI